MSHGGASLAQSVGLLPCGDRALCHAVLDELAAHSIAISVIVASHGAAPAHGAVPALIVVAGAAEDLSEPALAFARRIGAVVVLARGDMVEPAARALPASTILVWPCPGSHVARVLARIRPDAGGLTVPDWIVGQSEAFRREMGMAARYAAFDVTIVIEGETGTGKDMMARAIHYYSARRERPFIPVNCGAIPDHLFESEMFGHTAGAFTDAREAAPGLVGLAEGGTLFLDEVNALSSRGQVALLRFLQDRSYRPVGSGRQKTGDVRVVAASNRPLKACVASGSFREDLYFRLSSAVLELTPLRERPDDVGPLARHFARHAAAAFGCGEKRLLPDYAAMLAAQAWPGNVRELRSAVERAVLLADGDVIGAPAPAAPMPTAASFAAEKARAIGAFEKDYLRRLMARSHGNVTRAAAEAGKERKAFDRLLRKHGIRRSEFLGGDAAG